MASVEGREGVFFRLHPDLHNHHPMAPETIADLATLTQALAAKGTALIYAPVPVKSLAMPKYLSPATTNYGFDYSLATTVYLDALSQLQAAGVRAVDLRAEMVDATGPLPYFRTDPRLTAEGARLAAAAIGARPVSDFADSPEPLALILREMNQGGVARVVAIAAVIEPARLNRSIAAIDVSTCAPVKSAHSTLPPAHSPESAGHAPSQYFSTIAAVRLTQLPSVLTRSVV